MGELTSSYETAGRPRLGVFDGIGQRIAEDSAKQQRIARSCTRFAWLAFNLRKRSVISVYERPAARSEIRKSARDATARRVVTASAAKLKFRPHLHQSED